MIYTWFGALFLSLSNIFRKINVWNIKNKILQNAQKPAFIFSDNN